MPRLKSKDLESKYGVRLECVKDSHVGCMVWKAYKHDEEVAYGNNLQEMDEELQDRATNESFGRSFAS